MSVTTFLQKFKSNYQWQAVPAKRLFKNQKQINKGMIEKHRIALTLGGVIDRPIDDIEGLQPMDYETYQIFEKDDLVFKLIDLENIRTSRVGHVHKRGIMSPAYIRLSAVSEQVVSRYYYWFFYAVYLNNVFNGMGGGVRQSLNPVDLMEFPIPLTPEKTQRAIAGFLDAETARIDSLIAKKERQIALLTEKRAALITQAVTKGTNPTAPLRDSGIAWLGKIPKHWNVMRLKHIGKAIGGLAYKPDDVVKQGEGILVLRASNIQKGKVCFDNNVYVNKVIPRKLITQVGDILICSCNGSRDLVGKNALIDESSSKLSFGAFMTVYRTAHFRFVYYLMNSDMFTYHSGLFVTSTINQLTTSDLNSFEVPLPSSEEQSAIVGFLDKETAKIDLVVEKTQRTIGILREKRAALITEAVTGQLRIG